MGDLTIHDLRKLCEEELRSVLREERTKMFGAEASEPFFNEWPITLYSHPSRDPEE